MSMISHGKDDKEFTIGLFLDLAKELKTVNTAILLQKLEKYVMGLRKLRLSG